MVSVSNPLVASTTVYAILMLLLINQRPLLLFYENGKVRDFGFEDEQTIFPLHVVSVLLAIFIYLIMSIYSVV